MENFLNRNEQIIARATFSVLKAFPKLIYTLICIIIGICFMVFATDDIKTVMIVLGVVFLVVGWIPFIIAIIRVKSCALIVTNQRVYGKWGVINRNEVDLVLNKVDTASVQISFAGRIFNYGSIHISGSGNSVGHSFDGIKDVGMFKNKLNDAIQSFT